MNVGNTQSQSLVASVQVSRSTFEMKKTTVDASGTAQTSSLLVDAVQVDIEITGEFTSRVLRDSLEDKLNAAFEQAGIDTSVESLLQSGTDFSPAATAQRIVDFATGFFGQFQTNNSEGGQTPQLQGFATMIKGAIEEGFASAQDLLKGLGEISSGIQQDIDKTFELTIRGINDFVAKQSQQMEKGEEEAGATAI